MHQLLQPWLIVHLTLSPGNLWLSYEANEREDFATRDISLTIVPGESAGWTRVSIPPQPLFDTPLFSDLQVYIPADLFDVMRRLLQDLPLQRYGPHALGPVPLPLFINPPVSLAGLPWEQLFESLFPADIDPNRIQLARLARAQWSARIPFRLPLRIMAVGTESLNSLQELLSASFYTENVDVQAYGLHVQFSDLTSIEKSLRQTSPDVVVVNEEGIETVLRSVNKLPKTSNLRPRLIIFLGTPAGKLYLSNVDPGPGSSLLWISTKTVGDHRKLLKEFFYNIIHNYPMHEAIKTAIRKVPAPFSPEVLLIADPISNQDLRLSDALDEIAKEAFILDQTLAPGDIEAFLTRMDFHTAESLRSHLKYAIDIRTSYQPQLIQTRSQIDFGREDTSMVPLAQAERALVSMRSAFAEMRQSLLHISNNPIYLKTVQEHQERRVDMTLDSLNEDLIYREHGPSWSLGVRRPYRLRVHIGQGRHENSLMVGEVPPIDPLLPEPEGEQGHLLEVVVFEKGFKLLSPRLQPLRLPLLSGSAPVFFEMVAPETTGPAELRIVIYHKNHLLQSFLMQAQIEQTASWHSELQVTVSLELARTARFTNLDELKPRSLAISVNQNRNGTHSFMLKKDEVAARPINLPEQLMEDCMKNFRQMVEDATYDAQRNARFETYPAAGTPPSDDFKEQIRKFADFGRQLYRYLSDNATDDMQRKLALIAKDQDKPIQITRHDPNFVFPWAVVYDFPLAVARFGAPPRPVCMGARLADTTGVSKNRGAGCPHNPGLDVYCIYGFWGVRHRLEQLIQQGDSLQNAVSEVEVSPNHSGVCLALNLDDAPSQDLATGLQTDIQNALLRLQPKNNLLDLLWQPAQRPAMLIVLGHMETEKLPDEPEAVPRIMLMRADEWTDPIPIPDEKWLYAASITDRRIADGRWRDQPRTLVLLLACDSAATKISTLNNMVTSLNAAGAAAIIGTECTIFSGLAARFAREVTLDLWKKAKPLGEAVQAFNQRLMLAGNPLVFAYSCFGNIDLTIKSQ
jgi:hypothetical protein